MEGIISKLQKVADNGMAQRDKRHTEIARRVFVPPSRDTGVSADPMSEKHSSHAVPREVEKLRPVGESGLLPIGVDKGACRPGDSLSTLHVFSTFF